VDRTETDFRFDISLKDSYILAEANGNETPENISHVYEEIIYKMIEWNCNRVLYIEHLSNQISLQDMLIMWKNVFRLVEEKNISGRIAVFDSVKDHKTINLISESLAGAQGINAKVFNDPDAALSWLLK
jgi:hypothetical protein